MAERGLLKIRWEDGENSVYTGYWEEEHDWKIACRKATRVLPKRDFELLWAHEKFPGSVSVRIWDEGDDYPISFDGVRFNSSHFDNISDLVNVDYPDGEGDYVEFFVKVVDEGED